MFGRGSRKANQATKQTTGRLYDRIAQKTVCYPGPGATTSTHIQTIPNHTSKQSPISNDGTNILIPEILEFFLFNIQGINPSVSTQKQKIQTIEEEVNNSENKICFFALVESHLNDLIFDAEIQIKNYCVIRSDRTQRRQGGAALYLHQSITVDEIKKFSDNYTESVMVYLQKSKLIVIVIYRAPNTPSNSFRNCLESVQTFIETHKDGDVIMMGDFNFRFLDWPTETINKFGIPQEEQDQATVFLNFTHKHLLTQMVEENTRKDKSLLDLILTTDCEMIHSINIERNQMSDHDLVRCCFTHNKLQTNQETVQKSYQQKHPLDNLNLDRANWAVINEELDSIDWDDEMKDCGVEDMYKVLDSHITKICSNNSPKRTRITHKYKVPNERLALIRRKKRLNHKINFRKYSCENFPCNLIEKLEKKKEALELQIRESIKIEQEKNEINAIEKMKTNPKMFYSYVKKFRKTESKIGPLKDEQGMIHADAKVKAELLQKQYTKVFSDPRKASTDHINPNDELNYKLSNIGRYRLH